MSLHLADKSETDGFVADLAERLEHGIRWLEELRASCSLYESGDETTVHNARLLAALHDRGVHTACGEFVDAVYIAYDYNRFLVTGNWDDEEEVDPFVLNFRHAVGPRQKGGRS